MIEQTSSAGAVPKPAPPAQPSRRLLRVYTTALRVLLSYGLFALIKTIRGDSWAREAAPRWHRSNARRVLKTVLVVQGLFIKVGQLVSTLSNVLPGDFRQELEGLQDQIPPRPWEEMKARLRVELGRDLDAIFSHVDPQAAAAASLAQVHFARLQDGRQVALKVQHLNIEALAQRDLATIRRLLKIAGFFTGARGLDEIFDEVRIMITEELDFQREAEHLEQIAGNFAEDPFVEAPAVVHESSTPRLLVTTAVSGIKISDLFALEAQGIDRAALAERLLRTYCQMIFRDGLFHADPHPGNILVREDGGLIFLDFGAVGHVTPTMQEGIPQLLEAVLRRDRQSILLSLKRLGFVQRQPQDDVAQRAIDAFYARFLEDLEIDSWNLQDIHVDARMKLEMMADFRRLDILLRDITAAFRVPREWILLFRTLILLTGVCTQLHPELQPLGIVKPYLEEFVLGKDRDWLKLIRTVVQDLALAAATLPGDMKKVLGQVQRGELAIEVQGLREGASLFYALGHQLLFGIFTLGTGALAYGVHARGDEALAQALSVACGLSLLYLLVSLIRARKWSRSLRRGRDSR